MIYIKSKFFILTVNKYVLPIIFCIFTCCLLIFSSQNLVAAKTGLALWADAVLPSLFPFFIATELLNHTSIISFIGKLLNKIMRPFFNVPGEGAFAFLMGIISGYPVGAKIVTNLFEEGTCTKEESERLLAFTNNSGPLFIIGTVGISLFGDAHIGALLLFTHIIACISVGFVFRFWKMHKHSSYNNSKHYFTSSRQNVTFSNLGEILKSSIMNSVNTIVMIGGFVVLFSVVISILQSSGIINKITTALAFLPIPSDIISGIITGIIELTNGLKAISIINIKDLNFLIVIASFLLGFGGISVLLQVFSIVSKSGISIKPYIIGKFLHGIFAALFTFLILNFIPCFSMNLF